MLAILAALPPFAIDTYSPAIPNIANYFGVSSTHVMITFTTYFIGFSVGMLFWGPLSDKYGRKPIIFIAMLLYIVSTIICAEANSFDHLTYARLIQGFGDSAGSSIAFAVARDLYSGARLTQIIATIAMFIMIAPIIAPIIGTLIMHTGVWQNIFHFLTAYGVLLVLLSLKLPETHPKEKRLTHISHTFLQYKEHACNLQFILFCLSTSFFFAAFFSYIGSSAIIYIQYFNLSRIAYCLFFGINTMALFGANLFLKNYADKIAFHKIILIAMSFVILGALGLLSSELLLEKAYIAFSTFQFILTFGLSLATNVIFSNALGRIKTGFGTASAMMNALRFSFGGIANFIMSYWCIQSSTIPLTIQQIICLTLGFLLAYFALQVKDNSSSASESTSTVTTDPVA